MVSYWNTDSLDEAKYERVSVFHDIAHLDSKARAQRWQQSSEQGMELILSGLPYVGHDWTVLDVGCGVGRMLLPMSERFPRVVGLDISPKMLDHARDYLGDLSNVELVLGNGFDLGNIGNETFDLVVVPTSIVDR